MKELFAVKGNIIFTTNFGSYEIHENSYIIVENHRVKAIVKTIDEHMPVYDYGERLIIPGFVDLHVHAPQYMNLGLGLDKELLPWLEAYTFPEEAKFDDLTYAKNVYSYFIHELWKVGTTRACVFGTIHLEATKLLMDLFAEANMSAYIGKVNMDRLAPDYLLEDTVDSLTQTKRLIEDYGKKYDRIKPIITPRFIPSCSKELLQGLGKLAKDYQVPIQSHLSENIGEILMVRKLHPEHRDYASIYETYGLFGDTPTIMAHCVLVTEEEINLIVNKGVYVAHSPTSNVNLRNEIAPIRKLIERGAKVGLSSDISGGHRLSMLDVIITSRQVSNLKWLESKKVEQPLNTCELFYLATKGGGSFFGKVGSFEEGYEFDALVIDDTNISLFKSLSIEERLQKFIYTGDDRQIVKRYCAGVEIQEPSINP